MDTSSKNPASFAGLHLIEPLLLGLAKEGYTTPTPIQAQAIPALLHGHDLVGIAQTGTGKTAAFSLPILQQMARKAKVMPTRCPRVLILAPTRELAMQIGESITAYGRFLRFRHTVVYGGVGQGPQVHALLRGVDILVATPGRLLDLMDQGHVTLRMVEFFVLDEADRMLDMGFIRDVKKIVSTLPRERQSVFFSATMPPAVANLAHGLLLDPVRVEVTPQAMTVEKVEQRVFFVDKDNKDSLLIDLLKQRHLTCVLVFTKTKHRANKVVKVLRKNGIEADAIHGNKSQNQRMQALRNFKTGRVQVLVATDIAARGIDIEDISHVINYDLPNVPESYVHRIGRTARAGASGTAYSFCAAEERAFLRDIEHLTRVTLTPVEHKYHSEDARNAKGSAARPPPQQPSHRRKGPSRYGHSPRAHRPSASGQSRPQGHSGNRPHRKFRPQRPRR